MPFEPVVGGSSSSSSRLIYGNRPDVAVVTLWAKSRDVAEQQSCELLGSENHKRFK